MTYQDNLNQMHILYIVDGLRVGGAEKLIVTFAQELHHVQAKLTIVTLQNNVPSMVKAIEATGARIVPFHSRKLIDPKRFFRLWQFVKRNRFAVIHTHLTAANILGGIVGCLTHTPIFTTLHNTELFSQSHLYHGRLEDWVLKNLTDQIIGVGQEVADVHQKRLGLDHVVVLPNAVSIPKALSSVRREEIRAKLVNNSDDVLLLGVGRLEPQKGFVDMLYAFARLQKTEPQTRLLIAGRGPEKEILLAMIGTLNLEGRVCLLGVRDDIPDLLAAVDMFVSASHWEGLPVSLLEAMAARKPCVVTNVGDVSQVIDETTGILLPSRQPELMAEALAELIADPALWSIYGEAAYRRVCDVYSADVWLQKQLALYADAAHVAIPQMKPSAL